MGEHRDSLAPGYGYIRDYLLPFRETLYPLAFLSALLFFLVSFLERYGERTWCRQLCPLGTLLGIAARFSPLSRTARPGSVPIAAPALRPVPPLLRMDFCRRRMHSAAWTASFAAPPPGSGSTSDGPPPPAPTHGAARAAGWSSLRFSARQALPLSRPGSARQVSASSRGEE